MNNSSTRLGVSVELEPTNSTMCPVLYTARADAAISTNLEDLRAVLIEVDESAIIPLVR